MTLKHRPEVPVCTVMFLLKENILLVLVFDIHYHENGSLD